jgi:hypothetical protein
VPDRLTRKLEAGNFNNEISGFLNARRKNENLTVCTGFYEGINIGGEN